MWKIIQYTLESCVFLVLYSLFRLLPISWSRTIGAWISRTVGSFLPAHRIGRINLEIAFPDKSTQERETILNDAWSHFGKVCVEYCHTYGFDQWISNISIEGLEHLEILRKTNTQAVFVSAHLGNWALGTAILYRWFPHLVMVHRPPNNPLVNRMFHYIQKPFFERIIEKSPQAGIQIIKSLKQGKSLVMLMDQKHNKGARATLFNYPAMTSMGAAQLSKTLQIPMICFYNVRTPQGWKMIIEPPWSIPQTDTQVETLTQHLNDRFEVWIRNSPEQWFWMHQRFDKPVYQR